MANLNLMQKDVANKLDEFRKTFANKYGTSAPTLYDQRDIDRLNGDDSFAGSFLRTLKANGDPAKAADITHESLKFRNEIKLNDLTENSFPAELLEKKAIYYKGADKDGHPILYINVKANVTKPEHQDALKQYIAWNFEKHHRQNPEQMCVVLMDMSGASTSNVNTDITKFIITCFTVYFPSYLAYMINYDMPLLLSAFWTVISAFLSSEQKQKLLMVKKADIRKYIPEENLWPHMKQ